MTISSTFDNYVSDGLSYIKSGLTSFDNYKSAGLTSFANAAASPTVLKVALGTSLFTLGISIYKRDSFEDTSYKVLVATISTVALTIFVTLFGIVDAISFLSIAVVTIITCKFLEINNPNFTREEKIKRRVCLLIIILSFSYLLGFTVGFVKGISKS